MYRTSSARRELGMRAGPFTGGAVVVPWDAIDLKTRRRLLDARPIAAEQRRAQTFAMFAVACACGFALVMISGHGFGRVDEKWLVSSRWLALAYAPLLAGIIVPAVWLARRVLSAGTWFPWERALLQLDALERTPRGLVVRPFGDARFALIERGFIELQYADGSTFRVRTNVPPDVMNVAIGAAEDILARASLSDDRTHRDAIDALGSLRDDRGFSPRARATKLAGTHGGRDRSRLAFGVLALASFAAGWPVLALRNRTSDDAAFAYASQKDTRDLYEAYIDSGGTRHAREVLDERLPRIEFEAMKRRSYPHELSDFLRHYPRSRFVGEARAQLASVCTRLADQYGLTNDVFRNIERFESDHDCSMVRRSWSARFFEAQRQRLRTDASLDPAIRDAFIALVDAAEHRQARVPFRIVSSDDVASLVHPLNELAGMTLDVKTEPDGPREGGRLDVHVTPLRCPHAVEQHVVEASYELSIDGAVRATGDEPTIDTSVFSALTTTGRDSVDAVCERARYNFKYTCIMQPLPIPPDTR